MIGVGSRHPEPCLGFTPPVTLFLRGFLPGSATQFGNPFSQALTSSPHLHPHHHATRHQPLRGPWA